MCEGGEPILEGDEGEEFVFGEGRREVDGEGRGVIGEVEG